MKKLRRTNFWPGRDDFKLERNDLGRNGLGAKRTWGETTVIPIDADFFFKYGKNLRFRKYSDTGGRGPSINELGAKKEIIWMNSLTYRPWLKKDL